MLKDVKSLGKIELYINFAVKKKKNMEKQRLYVTIADILEKWNPIGVPDYIANEEYKDYVPAIANAVLSKDEIKKELEYILKCVGYDDHDIRKEDIQQNLECVSNDIYTQCLGLVDYGTVFSD
jgi:hypothetical protein